MIKIFAQRFQLKILGNCLQAFQIPIVLQASRAKTAGDDRFNSVLGKRFTQRFQPYRKPLVRTGERDSKAVYLLFYQTRFQDFIFYRERLIKVSKIIKQLRLINLLSKDINLALFIKL